MKKTKILKKNYEFKKVLTKGKYYSGKNIEAFIIKNNSKYNFLGLAISVKSGKAVKRNHVKRLIRVNYANENRLFDKLNNIYKNIEETISTGYSIVVLWKKKMDIKNANYQEIKQDMDNIIVKAKLNSNKENI